MTQPLDPLFDALRKRPHAELHGLEGAVWARIDAARARRAVGWALVPLRAACVAGALGLGLAGGRLAVVAAEPASPEISVFSVDTRLAPSTILAGR